MSLLLNVPFAEKDEVKRLGAWWNPEHKKWLVKYRNNYLKFKKWISKESSFYVIYDYFYIIEGIRVCFKCNKNTRVIGFGIEKYIEFSDEYENGYRYNMDDEIHIASSLKPMPDKLLKFIQHNYNYKNTYSNFAEKTYLANHCENCNIIQGNNYVFHECDSPFFLDEEGKALNLKLYKVSLNYDFAFDNIDMSFSSGDMLIKKLSKIQDSGLIL